MTHLLEENIILLKASRLVRDIFILARTYKSQLLKTFKAIVLGKTVEQRFSGIFIVSHTELVQTLNFLPGIQKPKACLNEG